MYATLLPAGPFIWRIFWILLWSILTYFILAIFKILVGLVLRCLATWYINLRLTRKQHVDWVPGTAIPVLRCHPWEDNLLWCVKYSTHRISHEFTHKSPYDRSIVQRRGISQISSFPANASSVQATEYSPILLHLQFLSDITLWIVHSFTPKLSASTYRRFLQSLADLSSKIYFVHFLWEENMAVLSAAALYS